MGEACKDLSDNKVYTFSFCGKITHAITANGLVLYYVLPKLYIVVSAIRGALQAGNKNRADFVLAFFIDVSCTRRVLFKSSLGTGGILSNLRCEGRRILSARGLKENNVYSQYFLGHKDFYLRFTRLLVRMIHNRSPVFLRD